MKNKSTRMLTLVMAACMAFNPSLSVLAQGEGEEETLGAAIYEEALKNEEAKNETEWNVENETESSVESEEETKNETEETVKDKVETESKVEAETEVETESKAEAEAGIALLSLDINGTRYEDGVYDFDIESGYKMFKIKSDSTKATIRTNEVVVTFETETKTYDRFYFGNKEDADSVTEAQVIHGTLNENSTGYVFTFTLPLDKMGQTLNFVVGKPDGTWYTKNQYTLTIPSAFTEPELSYTEGDYDIAIESGFKMFKIDADSQTAVVKDGKVTVSFQTTSNSFDKFYFGDKEEAATIAKEQVIQGTKIDGKDGYTFTFTLAASKMGQTLNFVPGKPDGTWYTKNQYTLTIPDKLTQKETPDETPDDMPTPDETPDETPDTLEDGMYNISVVSSASMFKVVKAVLVCKNGELSAVITLSGTSYSYLYMGSADEATQADTSKWIPYSVDVNGSYNYRIPVKALDTPIAVAAYSKNKNQWYDRTLTFLSKGMTKISSENLPDDTNNTPETEPETETETTPDTHPDNESNYESDTSGSTSRVNNATSLADGVYTPDQFRWSGGSGRASISCSKVTVENGQAYATIVFNSENYAYVKANGNTYYGSKGGGVTSFVIPVELNVNNRILGMTTAMSASHEVEYVIFVYISGAEGDKKVTEQWSEDSLSEEAPEIIGLEFDSETEIKYAELFKIFNYQNGITLLEVDISKYTANEKSEDATNKIRRYLIVPEDAELPAGLDEEIVCIKYPVESIYAASKNSLEVLEALELLTYVQATGFEEETDYPFAGSGFEPDYKKLVKAKTDVAIFSGELLPAQTDASGEKLTIEAQNERLQTITDRLETLEIAMLFDRSEDEKEDLAKAEWVKFYGALFGKQDEACELFPKAEKEAIENAEKEANENTEK